MCLHRLLLLSATSFVPLAGCSPQNVYQPPPPPTVTVAQPVRRSVIDYLEETGTTEAVAAVKIRARVRGYLEKVNFEPGAMVKKDDLLYLIQQPEFQAKVMAAQADVEAAEARRDQAKIERDRQDNLLATDPGATSDVAVQAARAEYKSAEAGVQAAQADLKQAELDLQYTEVRAPFDGRVGKTLVKAGNLVGDGEATHLTTVINYDPIYANFNISERSLLMLRDRGPRSGDDREDVRTVKVQLRRANDKGFPYEGHFDYADLVVDQSTGTYMIRGIFPNSDRDILPGLFVRVRIPIAEIENAILVPERAFSSDQAGRYLLIVTEDNTVERRNVIVGGKYDDLLVVEEGLKGDERVVIDGVQRARPGAKVDPQEEKLADAAETLERVEQGSPDPLNANAESASVDAPVDATNANNTAPTPETP